MGRYTTMLIFVLMLFSGRTNTDAQTVLFDFQNMPMYHAKVKFVDEFIARFNGSEIRKDVERDYADRESNILLLFNLSQFKSQSDTLFLEAKNFAHTIVQDSVIINYEDSLWYAKVKCHGTLVNKKVDFYLYLFVEERENYMYKWAIADAEGTVFNTSRTRAHKEFFMLPNDHEQSFLSLARVTDETGRYIDDFVKTNYEADALSVFLTLVRSGQLKINYVTDVEFVFLQVPNYKFTIKHFERENMNAGWLINSFEKCNETEKNQILCSLHRISNRRNEVVENYDVVATDSAVSEQGDVIETDSTNSEKVELSMSEVVVRRLGYILHLWMETGDTDYQKKALREFAGKKGRECTINDSIMSLFAINNDLPQDSTYKLNDYLAGMKMLITKGNTTIDFINIKKIGEEDDCDIVSCNVILAGEMNIHSSDAFYIRKNDNKVFHITALNSD